MNRTRRHVLATLGCATTVGFAGCVSGRGADDATPATGEDAAADGEGDETGEAAAPPTRDERLQVGHSLGRLDGEVVSGGVAQDGIPSIDDPVFEPAEESDLDGGEPVFGVVRDGDSRAYPQYVLVYHEIVNDTVGGDDVAVTYCPLTGTAQGFFRGDTEFGVSGRLVNSNLIMYDRGSDSWWPQVPATAIRGPERGESLREFRVIWTTWDRWQEAYPETQVLTDDTGFARRYGDDPYGEYNPRGGYYEENATIFPPLATDDRAEKKRVVIGARTTEGAVAFQKERLLDDRVLTADLAGTPHVAVADPELATGYVYANPASVSVEPDGETYTVDGEGDHPADDLPLERVLAFDAMWFAWVGFYPETEYVD